MEPLKILKWIPSREELWESVPENWKSEIPGLSGNGLIVCFICHFDTTWDLLGENSTEELSRSGFPEGGLSSLFPDAGRPYHHGQDSSLSRASWRVED